MRTVAILLILTLAQKVTALDVQAIRDVDGKTIHAVPLKIDGGKLFIKINEKTFEVPLERLNQEDRQRIEEQFRAAEKVAEIARLDTECEEIKTNTKTILEVKTDQRSNVGKPFYLKGILKVSSQYMGGGYEKAENTHFAFFIRDDKGEFGQLYMKREDAGELRKKLLDAGGSLKGLFKVEIKTSRFNPADSGILNAELLDYKLEGK